MHHKCDRLANIKDFDAARGESIDSIDFKRIGHKSVGEES